MIHKVEHYLDQLQTGKVEESLHEIKQLLTEPGMTDELQFEIAEALAQSGFVEDGIRIIEGLLEHYPGETELMLTLAEMYGDVDRTDEAIDLLNQIPADDEDYPRSLLLTAEMYVVDGLPEVAEQKIKQAMDFVPDEEPALFQALGEVFYQQEEYALALENFKKGVHKPHAKMAHCYAHLGDFEQALDHFERAVQNEAVTPDVRFGHGFMAYQLEKWNTASESLTKVIEMDPHYTSVYPLLADCYLKMDQREEAAPVIEQGLTYDETNPSLYEYKAEVLYHQGQVQEAEAALNQALEQDPQHLPSLEKLYEWKKGKTDPEDALHYLQRLTELVPARADLQLEQGELLEELERWPEAEQCYRQALEADEENVQAMNQLGFVLRDEGKTEEALKWWRKSLQINPEQWDIQEIVLQYEQ